MSIRFYSLITLFRLSIFLNISLFIWALEPIESSFLVGGHPIVCSARAERVCMFGFLLGPANTTAAKVEPILLLSHWRRVESNFTSPIAPTDTSPVKVGISYYLVLPHWYWRELCLSSPSGPRDTTRREQKCWLALFNSASLISTLRSECGDSATHWALLLPGVVREWSDY